MCFKKQTFFQALSYHGKRYEYSDLLIKNPDQEIEMVEIFETFPTLRDYNKLEISELLNKINIDLTGASCVGYRKTARKFLDYIDSMLLSLRIKFSLSSSASGTEEINLGSSSRK